MNTISFEWDEEKSKVNLIKHGISFEEAVTVFYDEKALEFYDDNNSLGEDRFLILGLSGKLRLLLVCHCYRKADSTIRIISARRATANESRYYGSF